MSTVAVRAFYHSPTTNVRLLDILPRNWTGFAWYGPGETHYDDARRVGELDGDALTRWKGDTWYHPEKGYAYDKTLDKVAYISNSQWVRWNTMNMTADDKACSGLIRCPLLETFFPHHCLEMLERMGFIGKRLDIPQKFIS